MCRRTSELFRGSLTNLLIYAVSIVRRKGDKSLGANRRVVFHQFSRVEKQATWSVAALISLRMLGLFMVFPVLGAYIGIIPGATGQTVGWAVGAYGLTQGLLQIPFGVWSDRWGRKPVLLVGLTLFILGSVVAALATDIWGIIIGRIVQGGGAIAAVAMALTADLTREETRTQAMGIIGISIGTSIMIALVLGPLLDSWIGVAGLFWVTTGLAGVGVALVIFVVPDPVQIKIQRDQQTVSQQIKQVLKDGYLMRLNLSIFFLHVLFAASFVVFPSLLMQGAGISKPYTGLVYLVALLCSVGIMVPLLVFGERNRRMKEMLLFAIVLLSIASLGLYAIDPRWPSLLLLMILFFGAFNFLEAGLPSLVSRAALSTSKGTTMGVYSSCQYLGTFVGGVAGGTLLHYFDFSGVFLFCVGVTVVWYLSVFTMPNPRYLSTYLLKVGVLRPTEVQPLIQQVTEVKGVAEARWVAEEELIYLRVDSQVLDEPALLDLSPRSAPV